VWWTAWTSCQAKSVTTSRWSKEIPTASTRTALSASAATNSGPWGAGGLMGYAAGAAGFTGYAGGTAGPTAGFIGWAGGADGFTGYAGGLAGCAGYGGYAGPNPGCACVSGTDSCGRSGSHPGSRAAIARRSSSSERTSYSGINEGPDPNCQTAPVRFTMRSGPLPNVIADVSPSR
jgi:hypothetical protein